MKRFFIHNEIEIKIDTIETIDDNGEFGDKRVELKKGERVDGGTEFWCDTNGGPRVITSDETDWSISIEQAADMLGGLSLDLSE